MASRYLAIYLNDHLAGSTIGLETARRAASENAGSELGTALAELAGEIAEDRRALEAIMGQLDVSVDQVKVAAAWAAEKVGRLKLNGHLRSYSPLSPLEELEVLMLGVNGKLALWRTLRDLVADEPRLDAARLAELLARGQRQLEELERRRREAAARAFAG